MLEVLLYLFQNYLHPDEKNAHPEGLPQQEKLITELTEAGFSSHEVARAFNWLAGIPQFQEIVQAMPLQPQPMRCYVPDEMEKLTLESRGFLLSLEQAGILNQITRELVIERAMALEVDEIDVDGMKWVVLMVLLKQPDGADAMFCFENADLDSREHVLH